MTRERRESASDDVVAREEARLRDMIRTLELVDLTAKGGMLRDFLE